MVKNYMRSIQWLTCAVLLMATAQNANAGVILNDSYVVGDVWQAFPPNDESFVEVNPLLNSSGTFVAAVGDVSLTMNHSLTQAGGIMAFDIDYSVAHTGTIGTGEYYGIWAFSQIVFTAVDNGSYEFSGSIDTTHTPGASINFENFLEDFTLHPQLEAHPWSFDYSTNGDIVSPGLVVFGQTPISGPYNTGSLTGEIVAGHQYLLETSAQYNESSLPTGKFHFQVTSDAAAVPEPSSVALLLAGGIGAVVTRYRRRRMQTSATSGRTSVL